MSSGKLILLLIAIVMIGLVLLLGYKLDKYEEKGKRKEKVAKKRENKEDDNSYSDFKSLKNDYGKEMEKTTSFGTSSFDFSKDTSKNEKYAEDFDKTAVIEKINLSKLEIEEDSYENLYEEPEIESDIEELEEIYEIKDEYDYESSNSSTMVFDTISVNEELDVIGNVKGYDFDEEDIETTKKKETKTTKKSTIKKVEEKPKTTRKAATKKTEEKPKTTRKAATKKTEEKTKTTRKTATKKIEEKPKTTRKIATKTATTNTANKAVKSMKTNTKK